MDKLQFMANSTFKLVSGKTIPLIGYGTYQLKGQDCVNGVRAALKLGYRHIDTASIYKNQEQIKKVLQQCEIPRQELFITSKISPKQQGYQSSRKAIEKIIQKLGCKYLDLILIHWPGATGIDLNSTKHKAIRLQTWKTFIEMQKQGKVRDLGVSNFLKHHLEHLFKNSEVKPVVNQFEIHPLLWQGSTIDLCRQHGIAIQAYSPLARQDDKLFKNQAMIKISEKHKKTIAQISLRWCLQNNFIILPKSKTESRIKENIDIYDFELDESDMQAIKKLRKLKVRTCWDPNSVKF